MENLNLTELNQLLKNIDDLTVVEKCEDYETTEYWEVLQLSNDLYARLEYYRDSYGYKEFTGLQFVKPTVIKLTQFEPI